VKAGHASEGLQQAQARREAISTIPLHKDFHAWRWLGKQSHLRWLFWRSSHRFLWLLGRNLLCIEAYLWITGTLALEEGEKFAFKAMVHFAIPLSCRDEDRTAQVGDCTWFSENIETYGYLCDFVDLS